MRRALELEPRSGGAWALLGSVHLDVGDYVEAEQALTRALDLGFDDPATALQDRAVARLELGRRAEALVDAKAACVGKPDREIACGLVRDIEGDMRRESGPR